MYNDVSLERIAATANVTVPTILRHFGSKEGILEAVNERVAQDINARRTVEPGNIDGAIAVLVEDYDLAGDMTVRLLAQEDRIPAIRTITDFGRAAIAAGSAPSSHLISTASRRTGRTGSTSVSSSRSTSMSGSCCAGIADDPPRMSAHT